MILYKIGNFFSKLIIKNIYFFIALGLIRWSTKYIPDFAIYEKYFSLYFLPLVLAYTAGNTIEKENGGSISAIASSLFLYLDPTPSINEGILIGITCGYFGKHLNYFIKNYIYKGIHMIVINFLSPLMALIIGFTFYQVIKFTDGFVETITKFLIEGINNIYTLIVLTPVLEIGKVFFFNNAINHGFLSILGFNQVERNGKSLLFLLETNPGPGLGVLLGILFFTYKKEEKANILSNIFIETIGGIHEIYFPYILKNLKLLWAISLGGITGNLIFFFFNAGLIGLASPGSILNILLLSPNGDSIFILLGFIFSTLVSFLITCGILNTSVEKNDNDKKILETEPKFFDLKDIKKIVFLCDAGMGSSAIGSSTLKQILKNTNFKDIEIINTFIGDSLDNKDLIITHEKLKKPIEKNYSENKTIYLNDFLDKNFYTQTFLKDNFLEIHTDLSLKVTSKEKALEKLGEDIERLNFAKAGYKKSILEREEMCSTYLGNGVAIPHGLHDSNSLLTKNAVVIHHYPYGINFEENKKVYILIGITIKNRDLRTLYLSEIAKKIEDEELIESLTLSDNRKEFIEAFNGGIYVK